MTKPAAEYPFYDLEGPIGVAHRGGNAAGVENQNTLPAFEAAQKLGYVYAETDIVASPEGALVISHDVPKKGQPFPNLTFEEVLTTFPDMRFFVDVKNAAAAKPAAELVLKLRAQDRVSLRGDNYAMTKDILDYFGNEIAVCTCLGKLGQRALKNAVWAPTLTLTRYIENSPATSFQMRHNKTSAKMIEIAHELGKRVLLWTPDTQEDIETSLDKGAHGVISNKAALLKDIILARDPNNQSFRH